MDASEAWQPEVAGWLTAHVKLGPAEITLRNHDGTGLTYSVTHSDFLMLRHEVETLHARLGEWLAAPRQSSTGAPDDGR